MRVMRWLVVCVSLMVPSLGVAHEGQVGPEGQAGYEGSKQPDRSLPWVTPEVTAPRVTFRTFESQTVGAAVSYHVFTPAAYDQPGRRLPVLYWLHGTDGGLAGIRPLAQHFDAAMSAGTIPPMIVVFVNGLPRRLWANSKDGAAPVETVFVMEVIADVDRQWRTIAARRGRILEGFSMGGYGAARIGFTYPELFAGISILAGGPLDLEFLGPRAQHNRQLREEILRQVCSNDMEYFAFLSPWTIAERSAGALREWHTVIRQVVGSVDDTRDLNRAFHERMTALRVPHVYAEIPNVGHDAPALLEALEAHGGQFYRRALGLVGEGGIGGRGR